MEYSVQSASYGTKGIVIIASEQFSISQEVMDTVKARAQETVTKIRKHPIAGPLGTALKVSSQIVKELGDFIPGAGIIGGALSIGAALLRPPAPSLTDLQEELRLVQEKLDAQGNGDALMRKLMKEKKEIREQIDGIGNPEADAVRTRIEMVEMKEILKRVGDSNEKMSGILNALQNEISQTFNMVTDLKYKVAYNKITFWLFL